MSKSSPTPPPAPDYAAANEAAVKADIASLPLRNAINAAATMGKSYTDPATGQVYDFSGLGTADLAHQQLMQQLADAPAATQGLLDLQNQFGTKFADSARNQLRATDPTGFALRESFGNSLNNRNIESLAAGLTPVPLEYAQSFDYKAQLPNLSGVSAPAGMQRLNADALPQFTQLGSGPEFTRLGNGPEFARVDSGNALDRIGAGPALAMAQRLNLADRGATAAGRGALEQQTFDELAKVSNGTLDPVLQRAAEQAARARGAASGNILGNGSALNEALAVQLAQQQRADQVRANASDLLSSGNTVSDTANRLQAANVTANNAATGQNNAARQQMYSNEAGRIGANNSASQQELANRVQAAGFNNSAAQQGFNNQATTAGFNNQAAQQGFNNQATAAGFNNAAAQQAFGNLGTLATFNNAAGTQDLNNQLAARGFNNTTAQQNFANAGTAAQQAFDNAMNAVNSRNATKQQVFSNNNFINSQMQGARQQDIANTQSFLGLAPVVSQAGQLANMQQQAAPFMAGNYGGTQLANANAGAQGAQFALGSFGTQANIFGQQSQNAQNNSFLGQMGQFANAAKNLGTAYAGFGCHVAREVYGADNGQWVVFYAWKEGHAPRWFRSLYNRYSKQVAALIRPFPSVKNAIRAWMDRQVGAY